MSNEVERCVICGKDINSSNVKKINVRCLESGINNDKEHVGTVNGISIDGELVRTCDICGNMVAVIYTLSNCEHAPFKVSLTYDKIDSENRD